MDASKKNTRTRKAMSRAGSPAELLRSIEGENHVEARYNKDNKVCFFHPIGCQKGEFVLLKDANVNIQTHALQYGTACIGGIRAYWNQEKQDLFLFRINDHFRRLIQSAHMLMMKIPYSLEELIEIAIQVLQKGEWKQNAYLRPIVYKASDELTPIMHLGKDGYAIYVIPLEDYMDVNKGLNVGISSWRRISDNQIPARAKASAGYLNSALAKSEAVLNGYDEAVFLDELGNISEGSAEKFIYCKR